MFTEEELSRAARNVFSSSSSETLGAMGQFLNSDSERLLEAGFSAQRCKLLKMSPGASKMQKHRLPGWGKIGQVVSALASGTICDRYPAGRYGTAPGPSCTLIKQ